MSKFIGQRYRPLTLLLALSAALFALGVACGGDDEVATATTAPAAPAATATSAPVANV